MKTALIITTINKPNKNILKFSNFCKQRNWELIVIGDKRSPKKYQIKYGKYLNLQEQKKLNFNYSKICPINSYSRKNIGYLIALHNNNDFLIETDDDNFPKKNPEISGTLPRNFQEKSRTFPEQIQGMSGKFRKCPGYVAEMFGKVLETFRKSSRKCPGSVPNISGTKPGTCR